MPDKKARMLPWFVVNSDLLPLIYNRGPSVAGKFWRGNLAELIHTALPDYTLAAIKRRLYSIIAADSLATAVEFADTIALILDFPIPYCYCGTKYSALERVTIENDITQVDMSQKDIDKNVQDYITEAYKAMEKERRSHYRRMNEAKQLSKEKNIYYADYEYNILSK